MMQAIVNREYGPPDDLKLQELEKPTIGEDSVLVRVRAASVNPYDWHVLRGLPYFVRLSEGLRRPKHPIPGVDVAGQVEAVGDKVTRFQPGDEVFGGRSGAFAEYLCGLERNFTPKPPTLSFEQAAAIPMAGCTALQALRESRPATARTEGSDQRRRGRDRHVRRPDRQGNGWRCDGGLQHAERRARQLDRC